MLLDTHVVLWALVDSPRLGDGARLQLRGSASACVSSVSIAEMRIQQMLGKLDVPDDLVERLAEQGLKENPLAGAHADAIGRFGGLARHDPFDRLLLAQASVEQMPFVTADARLLALGLDWIVDASV